MFEAKSGERLFSVPAPLAAFPGFQVDKNRNSWTPECGEHHSLGCCCILGWGRGTTVGLEQFAPGGKQLRAIYSMFKEVPWKRV